MCARIWREAGLDGEIGDHDVAAFGDEVVDRGLLAYYSAEKSGNGKRVSKALVKRVRKRVEELLEQQAVAA